jgi:hypothetical protein
MSESALAETFQSDELCDEDLDRGGLKFCCGGCVGLSG